jgi:hypothetical protein
MMPDNQDTRKEETNMKQIRIVIEITYEQASEAEPQTVNADTEQRNLEDWIDNPTQYGIDEDTREDLIRSGLAQEIVDASTVPQLLALQERMNAQIGQPKIHYGNGRKIHTCARCGADHRRSLERLNGRCLDCEHIEDGSIEWVTRGV